MFIKRVSVLKKIRSANERLIAACCAFLTALLVFLYALIIYQENLNKNIELILGSVLSVLLGVAVYCLYSMRSKLKEKSDELDWDTHELKLLEAERSSLIAMIDESSDFIGVADMEGNLLYHNDSARRMAGLPEDFDMSHMKIEDMHPPWAYKIIIEQALPTILEKGFWNGETAIINQLNGEETPVLQTATIHKDAFGKPIYITTIMRDITERKKLEEELKYIAYHDVLTGLSNRKQLDISFKIAISYAKRHQTKIAVLFMDLDYFKEINDQYGHDIGDLVLVEIALRLKEFVRENDILVRLGGDEFIIALTELVDTEHIKMVAQKILHAISRPMVITEHQLTITASLGISVYPKETLDLKTLIKYADQALYQAKSDGRDNFRLFSV